MATPVIMPRQGQSVESCIISKWHKGEGEQVKTGDLLFSYETDKASFDEEAKVDGTVLGIFFKEGDDVPCLTNVCAIGNPGEDASLFGPAAQDSNTRVEAGRETLKSETMREVKDTTATPVSIQNFNGGEHVRVSPRAKNSAEKSGVDYRYANPTGPNGRIIERDIDDLKHSGPVFTRAAAAEQLKADDLSRISGTGISGTGIGGRVTSDDLNAKESGPKVENSVGASPPLYEEVKLSNIRKVIAKTMLHSLSSMAQLTLNSSFDASGVLEFRKRIKEGKDKLGIDNITLNDIILYTVSRTLPCHKDLNAHLLDDRMLYFKNVNLGVAIDTERGLMAPTVFDANLKSLNQISNEVKQLAKDCQSGTINPDLLKGGSFTVTNLGTLGVESFTPVINPPQTGILGVNNIIPRVREVNGEFTSYPAMGLSLTFDHRALDGAPAARFLKDLINNLENFSAFLSKQ